VDESHKEQGYEKRASGLFRVFWALVLVMLLPYALSVGPALKICGLQRRGSPIFLFCTPLMGICRRLPSVERFFEWYVHRLWAVPYRTYYPGFRGD
jgi:hypothetical protein